MVRNTVEGASRRMSLRYLQSRRRGHAHPNPESAAEWAQLLELAKLEASCPAINAVSNIRTLVLVLDQIAANSALEIRFKDSESKRLWTGCVLGHGSWLREQFAGKVTT